MAPKKSSVPEGYQAVTPYLRVKGAAAALDFYKAAFGAKLRTRLVMGDRVGHAELDIGGARVMLSDEFPEMNVLGPKSLKGTTCTMAVFVANADKAVDKAVAAGAKVVRAPQNEFYGYRAGVIEDPFGHHWMVQQFLEDVPQKEMQRRLDAMMAQSDPKPADKAKAKASKPKVVAKKKG